MLSRLLTLMFQRAIHLYTMAYKHKSTTVHCSDRSNSLVFELFKGASRQIEKWPPNNILFDQ